jgi:hypothetical protein
MKKIIQYLGKPLGLEKFPHLSLIIPFSKEMTQPLSLIKLLVLAADKMEHELTIKYPKEQSVPLMKRLRDIIKEVKCATNEKTLAIFVSLLVKRISYFTPSDIRKAYMPPVLVLHDNYNRMKIKKY